MIGGPPAVPVNTTVEQVIELLQRVNEAGFDFIKIENLYNFDGKASYSAVQGE